MPRANSCNTLLVLLLLSMGCMFDWHRVACSGYGCPARILIRPCTCNEITKGLEIVCEGVRLDNLREVFENVQQTGQTLVYLKMKNNHMSTFPAMQFLNIDVRHLMCHVCQLEHVDPSAFSGLENKIESIDFSNNTFKQIPTESLRGLKSLVTANFNYNLIETINEKAFDGLDSLLHLSLFGNKIVQIHPDAFVGVGLNLTRMNLGGNQLASIPARALSVLKSIQLFQIQENRISSLRQRDLSSLKSSEHLDLIVLASNSIKVLEENTFLDLTLTSLDFENNRIVSIHEKALNGLQDSLEWLKLGENQLTEIPSSALWDLRKLRELDLRGNRILTVRRDSFRKFGTKIKFLHLQKNKIESIESGTFDHMKSLEWLYLQSNNMKHIPEHLFGSLLSHMVILDVADNPLECSCHIEWYRAWLQRSTNAKMQMVSAETWCTFPGPQHNHSAKQTQVLVQSLGHHQLKCNAFHAPLGRAHVALAFILFLVLTC